MSKYADIGNKIMEVINDFPNLDALASEDVDTAFFTKMDLSISLLKAIAGVKEEQANPPTLLETPLKTRYFYSVNTESLYVSDGKTIYCKIKDSTWVNVSDVFGDWEILSSCADIVSLSWSEYVKKLGDEESAPNDIIF
jgi:hypothetical protein